MNDPIVYLTKQRPFAAVISSPTDLAISLVRSLLNASCWPVVISEKTKDWETKIASTGIGGGIQIIDPRDKRIEGKFDYLLLINLDLSEDANRGRREGVEKAKDLTKRSSAKSLFIFPYVQPAAYREGFASVTQEILQDERMVATVFYVGQILGTEEETGGDLSRLMKDTLEHGLIRLPEDDTYFYPVKADDVSRELLRNLLSFGAFGKRVAIVSEPVSATNFYNFLKKERPGLKLVYGKTGWGLSIPQVNEKTVLITDVEEETRKIMVSYERYQPVPLQKKRVGKGKEKLFVKPILKSLQEGGPRHSFFSNGRAAFAERFLSLPRLFLGGKIRKALESGLKHTLALGSAAKAQVSKPPRRLVTATLAFLTVVILFPIILLFVSFVSLVAARASFGQKEPVQTEKLLKVSSTSGVLADRYFLALSKKGIGKPLVGLTKISNILARGSKLALSSISLIEGYLELSSKIGGEEIYDLSGYTGRLSLGLKSLYEEAGFLQGEISATSGVVKNFAERASLWKGVESSRERLLSVKGLTDSLPKLLGIERPTTYLFIFQNSSQLRPTGGLIEAYSLISFSDGRLVDVSLSRVALADSQLKGYVEPPAPIRHFLGETSWYLRDANWDPDFPKAANQVEWFLDKELSANVDGVVAVDTEFIAQLLELVMPAWLGDSGAVKITTQKAYELVLSKDGQGAVILRKLLTELLRAPPKKKLAVIKLVQEALETKRVQVFLHNKNAQEALAALNWDGAVDKPKCSGNCYFDWVGVVEANIPGSTSSHFIRRGIDFSSSLEEGLVKRDLWLVLENKAPSDTKDGASYKSYIRLLTPQESGIGPVEIISKMGREKINPDVYGVDGRKEAGVLLEVKPSQLLVIKFSWESVSGVDFGRNGEYRFYWRKQAGTKDYPVKASFNFPQNIVISETSPFSLTEKGIHGYNTTLSKDLILRIYW